METLINFIEAILPSLIVALVMAYWNRSQKKRDDQAKIKEKEQLENELMRIDLELASAQLAYAVAMAYKRGYPNGEMEVAIEQYEKAMDNFRSFERRQMVMSRLED